MSKKYVIIPAHNEEERLPDILTVMEQCLQQKLIDKVIIVNDASKDRTAEIIDHFAKNPNITAIHLKQNERMGGAIMKAYDTIKRSEKLEDADIIVKIDADLSGLTFENMDNLLRHFSQPETKMTAAIFGDKLDDLFSGMRAYRYSAIKDIFENEHNSKFFRLIGSHFDQSLYEFMRRARNGNHPPCIHVPWPNVKHVSIDGTQHSTGFRSTSKIHNPHYDNERALFNRQFGMSREIRRRP